MDTIHENEIVIGYINYNVSNISNHKKLLQWFLTFIQRFVLLFTREHKITFYDI